MSASTPSLPFRLQPPFKHDGGKGWSQRLPAEFAWSTDDSTHPRRCPLAMFEDLAALPVPHAPHAAIREHGGGRFSLWSGELYFSTSDGSDPNANGREYALDFRDFPAQEGKNRNERRFTPPLRAKPAYSGHLNVALVGAGQRGFALARMAGKFPQFHLQSICDPRSDRAAFLQKSVTGANQAVLAPDLASALALKPDVVFLATPDARHRQEAEQCFAAGCHVFLEKPVATDAADAQAVVDAAAAAGRVLHIGFVLRHAPFYQAVREVVASGDLGDLQSLHLSEQLELHHGASFWRRWHRHSAMSGGLIVHKSCHDLDLMLWLSGGRAAKVASFGGAREFAKRHPPAARCSQCAEKATCRYAYKAFAILLTDEEKSGARDHEADLCVYAAGSDIVENQTVIVEFEDGLRATYALDMFGAESSGRAIKIVGTRGTLTGTFESNEFDIAFNDGRLPLRTLVSTLSGHGGGDKASFEALLAALDAGESDRAMLDAAVAGLQIAGAAEKSRKTGTVVTLLSA